MRIACITPIDHITGVHTSLDKLGDVFYLPHPTSITTRELVLRNGCDVIFTNPNMQGFMLGRDILSGTGVRTICTASTGTNHIDREYCEKNEIHIISITRDTGVLERITSTAEHAFALMMSSLRMINCSDQSVRAGAWSWEPFLSRQLNCLTVGIVGYGRLGKMMANYCKAFGAQVLVVDPYVPDCPYEMALSLEDLVAASDIISLHVHVSSETRHMISGPVLSNCRKGLILVNTSRGEIVDEHAVAEGLRAGKIGHYATDVLENEFTRPLESPLLDLGNNRVTITPHVGGSTSDAQAIAYNHAVRKLDSWAKDLRTTKQV